MFFHGSYRYGDFRNQLMQASLQATIVARQSGISRANLPIGVIGLMIPLAALMNPAGLGNESRAAWGGMCAGS